MKALKVQLLCAVVVCCVYVSRTTAKTYSVSGIVLDSEGSGCKDYTVTLIPESPPNDQEEETNAWICRSDASGHFFFSGIPTGTYFLNVMPPVQIDFKYPVRYGHRKVVLPDLDATNIVLQPLAEVPMIISGRILDHRSHAAVAARIKLFPREPGDAVKYALNDYRLLQWVECDADGQFTLHDVPAGAYYLTIQKLGDTNELTMDLDVSRGEIVPREPWEAILATDMGISLSLEAR